jgi:hypothetical protein
MWFFIFVSHDKSWVSMEIDVRYQYKKIGDDLCGKSFDSR